MFLILILTHHLSILIKFEMSFFFSSFLFSHTATIFMVDFDLKQRSTWSPMFPHTSPVTTEISQRNSFPCPLRPEVLQSFVPSFSLSLINSLQSKLNSIAIQLQSKFMEYNYLAVTVRRRKKNIKPLAMVYIDSVTHKHANMINLL